MAMLMLAGSAIMGAVSSVASGIAQSDAQRAQANANRYNAGVAQTNAENVSSQTVAAEETQRRKARQVLGSQRAALAQTGFDPGSGSLAGIYDQSVMNAEMDALNLRYEGKIKRQSYLNQSSLYNYMADVNDNNASNAIMSAGIGAASSIFSGSGTMAKANAGYSGAGGLFGLGG